MIIPFATALAIAWSTVIWNFLAVIVVFLSIFLCFIILIQDSKGAGLTSAFGAGPGGESLLGARMQKDVARWTAYIFTASALLILIMGFIHTYAYRYGSVGGIGAGKAAAEAPESNAAPDNLEKPEPGPGAGAPGESPKAAPGAAAGGPAAGTPSKPPAPAPGAAGPKALTPPLTPPPTPPLTPPLTPPTTPPSAPSPAGSK